MNDSADLCEGTPKQTMELENHPEPENTIEVMAASTTTIIGEQDAIDNHKGSPSTSPSLESPQRGMKRKSRVNVPSPAFNTVNSDADNDSAVNRESTVEKSTGRWTIDEHEAFVRGLSLYGREWKRVAQIIPTRTAAQVRSHAQKYFQHLEHGQQRQLLQQQQQQQDPFEHQKFHQNDAFDFNYDISQSHETNQRTMSDFTAPFDLAVSDSTSIRLDSGTMSDSVREEAARIMANPTSVHHEVNMTLQQLRQRYRDLQNRLAQLQRPSDNSTVGMQQHEPMITARTNSEEANEHAVAIVSNPNQSIDEQIVVQVLQARLMSPVIHQQQLFNSSNTNSNQLNSGNQPHENLTDYDGDIETDTEEMSL